MTKIKTTIIAAALTLISMSAYAGDDLKTLVVNPVTTSSSQNVLAAKSAVSAETGLKVQSVRRVMQKPEAVQVVRKANMTSNKQFVYSSEKNTNAKTYRPAAQKSAGMPNLFKK